MDLYHGTSTLSAGSIIGPPNNIDVTKGRGELGRGFYAGSEPSLAATLARGKYGSAPAVLQITFQPEDYLKLDIKILKTVDKVNLIWKRLIASKQTTTHLFNVDVVVAPFASIDFSCQYKFESLKAEIFLNNCDIKKIL